MRLDRLTKIVKEFPKYLYPVGSFIRKEPNPNDLDMISTKSLDEVLDFFENYYDVLDIPREGKKIATIIIKIGKERLKLNIWKADKETLPFFKLSYSYPRNFIIGLRRKAKTHGYLLNDNGLFKNKKRVPGIKNEKDIFRFLDVTYRTPAAEYKKLLKGGGVPLFLFKNLANLYRRNFCQGKSRPLEYGEVHLPPCSNYCGPGTRIDLEKVRNYPPFNEIDNICRTHDLGYLAASKLTSQDAKEKAIRQADEVMLRDLEKFKDKEGYTLAKLAISAKNKAEDLIPFVLRYIAPSHFGSK